MFGRFIELVRFVKENFGGNLLVVFDFIDRAFDLGTPPDVDDEPEFRVWCGSVATLVNDVATATPNKLDDAVAQAATGLIENDKTWNGLYALILLAVPNDGELSNVDIEPAAIRYAEEVEMDPATILLIVRLVAQLVAMWRQRKKEREACCPAV